MFPDYEPPVELHAALSQAAIVAADILPEMGRVEVAVHSESYIPKRLLQSINSLVLSFIIQLSHPYMTTGKKNISFD